MNPKFNEIGNAFVQQFYTLFDNVATRPQLAGLYTADSMMTFEGAQMQGTTAILEKITNLPFQSIVHSLTTIDCQPTYDGGVSVLVVGQLKTDTDHPHGFSQVFFLKPTVNGTSFYIANEFFRLSIHNVPS
ncbi:PREDICTED: probable nuclear transport factor 2 [Priapulus caudatus]|uniref:NTF2-related export protein n=1 Tax=Priapulus caudatus TaxID=37621 RepID=A0ABM1EDU8_PRICU|nr:PREDICTED: probable nuclear transport factor 2 [Priapulus caudatus]